MWTMAGTSPLSANEEQRRVLADFGRSRDRGEADRARAVLLTLAGWTSPAIAVAFGVREDTVRLWRSAFMAGGVGALGAGVPSGAVAAQAARAADAAQALPPSPAAGRADTTP